MSRNQKANVIFAQKRVVVGADPYRRTILLFVGRWLAAAVKHTKKRREINPRPTVYNILSVRATIDRSQIKNGQSGTPVLRQKISPKLTLSAWEIFVYPWCRVTVLEEP